MRETARRNRNAYEYGSAARQLRELPEYEAYKRQRAEQVQRELEEKRRRDEERARRERSVRRNQMRELSLSRGYVTFLAIAGVITAGISAGHIKLQSDMTAHMKNISRLESQLEDVRADNSAAEKRLNTTMDLCAIKQAAIMELGMVYAGEDQVVYYTVDNSDYMNQYADIPD